MIIALAGRMGSGKSELAKICINKGFKVVKFADGLKDLICRLIKIDREFLECNKEVYKEYFVSFSEVAKEVDIEESLLYTLRSNTCFYSIRELLQFLGTDVIRKYKPGWHIEILKNKIKDGTDYCIDDLRFEDELAFINRIGGESWFISRPGNFNYSNHTSETSLNWSYFGNNVIINDTSLSLLLNKWDKYLELSLNTTCKFALGFYNKVDLRDYLYKNIVLDGVSTDGLSTLHECSRDAIIWWCSRLMVPVKRNKYLSDKYAFLYPDALSSYYAGLLTADGCIKNSGKSSTRYVVDFGSKDKNLVYGFSEFIKSTKPVYCRNSNGYKKGNIFYYSVIENPFIIENLKLWNLKPRKSSSECIPDIIKDNEDLLKQWIVGLIDGDGSIYAFGKNVGLTILSSKDVIHFIQSVIPVSGIVSKHKNTNLFEIKWYNHKVVDVKDWLNPQICLNRKWIKIEEFKRLNTKRKSSL